MKAKKKRPKRQSYGLGEDFERDVMFLCATRPKFWGMLGALMDPQLLGMEVSQTIWKACAAIATDVGRGPDSTRAVVQRLRRLHEQGDITHEAVNEAIDMFEEVEEEGGASDEDVVAAEMIPILKKLLNRKAGAAVMDAGAGGDLSSVRALIEAADAVGKVDVTPGVLLSRDAFREIAELGFAERLPSGIEELDLILGGGIPRGQYWLVQGGTGGGKSMLLTQYAAESIWEGKSVAFATVGELGEGLQKARLLANLTNCLTNDIIAGIPDALPAMERYDEIADNLGPIVVQWFDGGTTVQQLKDWVKTIETAASRVVDVIIIDYIDELDDPRAKSEYAAHKYIGTDLHSWAEQSKRWIASATQAGRQSDKRKDKRLDVDSSADSQNKPRKCDGMITVNPRFDEDGKVLDLLFYLAKYRTGQAYLSTDRLPVDMSHGRIVPIKRDRPPLRVIQGGKA